MPCNDITEVLILRLDASDRLEHYTLHKMTCGGTLGMPSLISGWAKGKTATQILETPYEEFLTVQPTRTFTGELVHLKHLFAMQKGLAALTGGSSGTPNEACVIDSIIFSEQGVELTALIKIDHITEEIKACTGCGSCGSKFVTPPH